MVEIKAASSCTTVTQLHACCNISSNVCLRSQGPASIFFGILAIFRTEYVVCCSQFAYLPLMTSVNQYAHWWHYTPCWNPNYVALLAFKTILGNLCRHYLMFIKYRRILPYCVMRQANGKCRNGCGIKYYLNSTWSRETVLQKGSKTWVDYTMH